MSDDGKFANPTILTSPTVKVAATQTSEAAKDVFFGSIAGCIGKVIEYPFDTVKVRLQSQSLSRPVYDGPLDCFRQAVHADGFVKGLYRGISAPLVGAAIETSSLFFSYRIAQNILLNTVYRDNDVLREKKNLTLGALVGCGAISGAFTSLLLTPIELVKCQMQVPIKAGLQTVQPNPLRIIVSVFRNHGILGFWHGQLGTLIRETGGSAAWFGSYEGMSKMWRVWNAPPSSFSTIATEDTRSTLPLYQQLVSGALAGVAYNFVFFPADTVKSRMQTEDINSPRRVTTVDAPAGQRANFWSAGKTLWQQQGLRGMYRGCGITVARAAPSSAFIFAVYEGLRGWWD